MKKILITTALSVMLVPAVASAELNYNMVGASYAKTSESGFEDITGFGVGVSKSITSNVFLEGAYTTSSRPSGTTFGDVRVNGWDIAMGYHTPIQNDIDLIAAGHLLQSTAEFAGASYSANGYRLGVGLRVELTPEFEGKVLGTYTNVSSNSFTTTSTGMNMQLGFKVTPELQLFAGVTFDSHSPRYGSSYSTQTMGFGGRFYY